MFRWRLLLQDGTILFRECDGFILSQPPLLGKNIFHELYLALHLLKIVGKWNINMELLKYFKEFGELIIQLTLFQSLGVQNFWCFLLVRSNYHLLFFSFPQTWSRNQRLCFLCIIQSLYNFLRSFQFLSTSKSNFFKVFLPLSPWLTTEVLDNKPCCLSFILLTIYPNCTSMFLIWAD